VFSYPLNAEEVYHSLDRNSTNVKEVQGELQLLSTNGLLGSHDGFFGFGDLQRNVARRLDGNKRAVDAMPLAMEWSSFISGFPYVRGVFLSGSISKNFMEDDGDIDYFLVTEPGRLWLSRTILVLYKKLLLFNSHKYFCVNYFVDTEHMEIEEKNLFTATELVTLIPACGPKIYDKFRSQNTWVENYFPNFPAYNSTIIKKVKTGMFKRLVEATFNNPIGSLLDRWCMNLTVGFWKRKFTDFEKDKFDVALKSRPYVSKHHPNNYQAKVLSAFEERLSAAGV